MIVSFKKKSVGTKILSNVKYSFLLILCLSAQNTFSLTAYAQKEKASNVAKPQKSLDTSKKIKFKDKTAVDFDAASIDGTAKNPFGSIIQSRDQDFDKGFIKLRYNWHDQMVMSLSGLSGN